MAIGLYVGIGTISGFVWWYMFSSQGPHVSFWQLTHFHDCKPENVFFKGVDCAIFHDARPSTVSLSILVVIEMLNALNALSENQSLLVVTPSSNMWVVGACSLSLGLHVLIVYVPFFSNIFHVAHLTFECWLAVILLSVPVVLLDEAMKFVSRLKDTGVRHTHTE